MRCKICKWFSQNKWLKGAFEKEVSVGHSLRELSMYLKGQGLSCSPKTVSKHLKNCMGIKVQKKKGLGSTIVGKLGQIIRPEGPLETKVCEHLSTECFYDLNSELVYTRCKTCKAILGSQDTQGRGRLSYREKKVLEDLR